MATISDQQLNNIKKLYRQGLSVKEITKKLNISIDAGYYFFRKHKIKRRTAKESNSLQFERRQVSFNLKKVLTSDDKQLKIAGIMLYWAEGSKWSGEKNIDFANSDSEMIKIFLSFLRKICGIDENKLRIYLYCYSNQKPEFLIEYWSKLINIPKKQFTKPYIRKDYRENKIGKMKYGLIHVRYYDKKLFLLIMKWIKDFPKKVI